MEEMLCRNLLVVQLSTVCIEHTDQMCVLVHTFVKFLLQVKKTNLLQNKAASFGVSYQDGVLCCLDYTILLSVVRHTLYTVKLLWSKTWQRLQVSPHIRYSWGVINHIVKYSPPSKNIVKLLLSKKVTYPDEKGECKRWGRWCVYSNDNPCTCLSETESLFSCATSFSDMYVKVDLKLSPKFPIRNPPPRNWHSIILHA